MLYRILTEDVDYRGRCAVEAVAESWFAEGFTVLRGRGQYHGQKERALILEVILPERQEDRVFAAAQEIKTANHQHTVLVERIPNECWTI